PDVHFFFNHPASPRISTLSLHDALPISGGIPPGRAEAARPLQDHGPAAGRPAARLVLGQPQPGRPAAAAQLLPDLTRGAAVDRQDRKSTRLNSSHVAISYAVFCLKKKKR